MPFIKIRYNMNNTKNLQSVYHNWLRLKINQSINQSIHPIKRPLRYATQMFENIQLVFMGNTRSTLDSI